MAGAPGAVMDAGFTGAPCTVERQLGKGIVFQANHEMWEVIPVNPDREHLYICSKCRNITSINIRDVCPTFNCDGKLELLNSTSPEWRDNHYRKLYQELDPVGSRSAGIAVSHSWRKSTVNSPRTLHPGHRRCESNSRTSVASPSCDKLQC